MEYIHPLQRIASPQAAGHKALRLKFLEQHGYRIPATLVCTSDAFAASAAGAPNLRATLAAELLAKTSPDQKYAVRSSASAEDAADHSFAGQFQSLLDVEGQDNLLEAIEQVWASANSHRVRTYQEEHGIGRQIHMAVLIQEMVTPVISGVAFSRNPITGLVEVVVEAVRGSGESLLQRGVAPERWIHKWGDWIEAPGPEAFSSEVVSEIVDQVKQIEATFGKPVDLEWVFDGKQVTWVQLRELGALETVNVYSNRISREVFPGIIKPLVWSVNTPMVNGAWVRLFTELIGENDLDPNRLAKSFYSRAYFNMGAIGKIFEALGLSRETLEILMGIEAKGDRKPTFRPGLRGLPHWPRLLRFALDKIRFSRKIETFLPAMRSEYEAFDLTEVDQLTEEDLLKRIDRLLHLNEQAAYYNIVTPLLMQFYTGLLKRFLTQVGVDFESYDLTRGVDAVTDFDPNLHLAHLRKLYSGLESDLQEELAAHGLQALQSHSGLETLCLAFNKFLSRFGHLSDSGNDLSSVPWREDPEAVLQMAIGFSPPRQIEGRLGSKDLDLPLTQRILLGRMDELTHRYLIHREAIGFLYTYGYGLFRPHFLAVGNHFVRRGILREREDIMYLTLDEIKRASTGTTLDNADSLVGTRKAEIKRQEKAVLPDIIYGDEEPPVTYVDENRKILHGTPTSRGYFQGPARVVRGIGDFGKVRNGDVLLIPFSDVGWTPLFTMAGAVVAESGGILSHSSIIAREYSIPAVVSVTGACRIKDDTLLVVDGYRGTVSLVEEDAP